MNTKNYKNIPVNKISIVLIAFFLLSSFTKKVEIEQEKVEIARSVIIMQPQQMPTPKTLNGNYFTENKKTEFLNRIKNNSQPKIDTAKPKVKSDMKSPVSTQSEKFTGVLPQFPGGVNAFRNLVNMNFDSSSLRGEEGTFTTTLSIDIEEDGKMSNITAEGENKRFNQAAIRSVKSIKKQLWQPATENGKPVKYLFTMPLTIELEKPLINN